MTAPVLRALSANRQRRARLVLLDAERDELILQAIAAGIGAPTIATHAGLTAARVYQIRDGKR